MLPRFHLFVALFSSICCVVFLDVLRCFMSFNAMSLRLPGYIRAISADANVARACSIGTLYYGSRPPSAPASMSAAAGQS